MHARLADGTGVVIRPIAPADKERLVAGHSRLSEETVRLRFLGPKPRLSPSELRYLTEVDGSDHYALVAVLVDDPHRLIAVARYVRLRDDPETAEFAIVVGDAFQRRGLGTLLAGALADAAQAHHIHRFTASVLSENVAARALIAKLSRRLPYVHTAGPVSELEGELAA